MATVRTSQVSTNVNLNQLQMRALTAPTRRTVSNSRVSSVVRLLYIFWLSDISNKWTYLFMNGINGRMGCAKRLPLPTTASESVMTLSLVAAQILALPRMENLTFKETSFSLLEKILRPDNAGLGWCETQTGHITDMWLQVWRVSWHGPDSLGHRLHRDPRPGILLHQRHGGQQHQQHHCERLHQWLCVPLGSTAECNKSD